MSGYKRLLKLLVFLALAVIFTYFGSAFISSISGEFYLNNPIFHLLFALNFALVLVFIVYFVRNLVLFFFPRMETRIRTKLFMAFLILVIGPSLFSVFLSSSVVNRGLDRLLRIQSRRMVSVTSDTTKGLLNLYLNDLAQKAKSLSKLGNVDETVLFKYGISGYMDPNEQVGDIYIDGPILDKLRQTGNYHFIDYRENRLTLCKVLDGKPVCVSKNLPLSLTKSLESFNELSKNYRETQFYKSPIKAVYSVAFMLMGLSVLFGALWFARYFERNISVPISSLYMATRQVSRGKLNVEVKEQGIGEIKHVIFGFNYMLDQLKRLKQGMEKEKLYIETILNNISPAVVSFNSKGDVTLFNESARRLLNITDVKGILAILSAFPNLKRAVTECKGTEKKEVNEHIDGKNRKLLVEIIPLSHLSMKLLIVEDITNITRVQKLLAWKEAVKKIAGNIKLLLKPMIKEILSLRSTCNETTSKSFDKIIDNANKIEGFLSNLEFPVDSKDNLLDVNSILQTIPKNYRGLDISLNIERIPLVGFDGELLRKLFLMVLDDEVRRNAKDVSISTSFRDGKVVVIFRDNAKIKPDANTNPIINALFNDMNVKAYFIDRNSFIVELQT